MKKKHRRTVCNCLIWLIKARWIFFPIVLIAGIITFAWLDSETWDYKLERKFKVYDYDPDFTPKTEKDGKQSDLERVQATPQSERQS